MLSILLVFASVVPCWVAWRVSGPVTPAAARREHDRRARFLEHHLTLVNHGDVERILEQGLSREGADQLWRVAQQRGIAPGTLWIWVRQHGVPLLALAVAAGFDEADLRFHLARERVLDRDSLRLLAELNGVVVEPGKFIAPSQGPEQWLRAS